MVSGRRCMFGDDCAEPGWLGDDHDPMCPSCYRGVAAAIDALPHDYLMLSRDLIKTGGTPDEAIARPKPKSTPPLDLGVDDLMRRLVWTAGIWEFHVRDHLGLQELPMESMRPGWLLNRAALCLVRHLPDLIRLPPVLAYLDGPDHDPVNRDGIDAALTFVHLHRRALARLGLVEPVFQLPGPCPGCNAPALRRVAGREHVWCEQCKRSWPYTEYQRYVALVLDASIPLTGDTEGEA